MKEEREANKGIDKQINWAKQIAWANLDIIGGTPDDQRLFTEAKNNYETAAKLDPSYVQAGPHVWRDSMGRAELHLSRVAFLNEEVWSLIGAAGLSSTSSSAPSSAAGSSTAIPAAPATKSANGFGTISVPIDLVALNAFTKSCTSSQTGAGSRQAIDPQTRLAAAHAVCLCLAAEIQSLHEAVLCFDQAVAQSTDLVEAYRDRGLAYLALARCEATLATILDALKLVKFDPVFQNQLATLDPQLAMSSGQPGPRRGARTRAI